LNTELKVKNTMQGIGTLSIPVLRYSFGIINWHREEIRKLERKTIKILIVHGQHHPGADTDRLYVPRKEGGSKKIGADRRHTAEVMKLMEYI
jgi:hypothetical protein